MHLCWPCIRTHILEAWLTDKLRLQLGNEETQARKFLSLMAADKAGDEVYAHMEPERFRRVCSRGEFTGFAEEVARRLGLDVPWKSEGPENGVGTSMVFSDSDSDQGKRKTNHKADGVALGTSALGHSSS